MKESTEMTTNIYECNVELKHTYLGTTRLSRRVPLVEQELITLPEHLSSPRFLVGFVLLDHYFYVYVL